LFEQWSQETPPDLIVEPPAGQPQPFNADASTHTTPISHAGHAPSIAGEMRRYRGIPTGTGRGRGRVCLLRHPLEGHKLQPGDILVARSTDPGWTPLFLKASGLIVETGGYLSHGAIVAREFAIPAVVNLPGILDRLKDGDMVEVDGTTGGVSVLEEPMVQAEEKG
jgi:pyruvate,water dikinase